MTRAEVLAFIRERAKAWRSMRGLDRDEQREMRAWASGAERIASDLAREWMEEADVADVAEAFADAEARR